ncbi:arsenite methyltransferase [Sulfurimonas sp.]|uniref:arsenite methyltransferase n=1 Tax=Sulfurimonas sp. TaxID=2022749 RepID=UPI001A02FFEA|nr:arsenite methyltransferase [Sulfurimonas sp.]MBE0514403.1 arsenite methyltransferase [Sulfurimonas sp.]
MNTFTHEQKRAAIAQNYARIASDDDSCGCAPGGCCSSENISLELGYSKEQLNSIPSEADKGLGCGNPTVMASLKKGEVVLDLGSGAGLDCFLASIEVGEKGVVIGVDMTREMIAKARSNRDKNGYDNVDFRLGEIENLPVADDSVDVIISNCVINLSLGKQRVFDEAFRVLKTGGRLAISDIVLTKKIPSKMITLDSYGACISGASFIDDLEAVLKNSGFKDINITPKSESKKFLKDWSQNIEDYIVSANIEAVK